MAGLLDFLQAASNAAASNVTGPIDLLSWALKKGGVPVGDAPMLGSEWMKRQGLMRYVPQSAASLAGETVGLLAPIGAAAKAPQIAAGILAGQDLAKQGAKAVGTTAADMTADYMARQGLMPSILERNGVPIEQTGDMAKKGLLGYAGGHRPVTVEGGAARLHDLTPAFGEDIYTKNAAQFYGTGDRAMDATTLRVLNSVKGKPDELVTVYRAVPKDAKDAALNAGDWVTVNKAYAKAHGEGTLEGQYRIIEQKVPASHLTTNADSFHEQGYYPK